MDYARSDLLTLCPGCGHQCSPRAACVRCGYDPFAGRGYALSAAFGDLTPIGQARQEAAFIALVLQLLLRRLGLRPGADAVSPPRR